MATITKKRKTGIAKNERGTKRTAKRTGRGFEKAWEFWKTAQVNLSNFRFDREEANAR
ncbi:MAG: hypothetical protein K2U26_06735 [Cyclobacteriaceae bacterium]|nr:hypothetical protein [Cyclobacteriaceae bacterium]